MTFQPVKPLRPIAAYQGGKRYLAKAINARFEAMPHTTYVEPFCGMGGIFFRRTQKSKIEVINDYNSEIANFFRVVQRHHAALIDLVSYSISSRVEFNRQRVVDPKTLTDLERAARFLYLQRIAFGGRVTVQAFGVRKTQTSRFNPKQVQREIEAISNRLATVTIEQLNYADCIRRYDSPDTLFYLDPPYWGSEHSYGEALFSPDEFAKLATQLETIQGKFILSLNHVPEVRKTFEAFHMEVLHARVTVAVRNEARRSEVLISNSGECRSRT